MTSIHHGRTTSPGAQPARGLGQGRDQRGVGPRVGRVRHALERRVGADATAGAEDVGKALVEAVAVEVPSDPAVRQALRESP